MSNTQKSNLETTINYKYTAEEKYQPKEDSKNSDKQRFYCPYPYFPSDDLKEAVNLAIALKRPLLLSGEPGCGKTRLAGAVAYEFTQKYLQNQQDENSEEQKQKWWDYYIWNIKSTTRYRDGLYKYDAIARLRDTQFIANTTGESFKEIRKIRKRLQNKQNYRQFGPLGNALKQVSARCHRPILLIDEIDKADNDFANDLLFELEELRFEIPETGESFPTPDHKPIIFITSNNQKPLPEAFLRRCLYFDVKFPDSKDLEKIIHNRFIASVENKENKEENKEENQQKLVNQAIEKFYEIRERLKQYPGSKPPGTSEFIDFITALLNKQDVANALDELKNLSQKLPLLGTLTKTSQDQDLILDFLQSNNSQESE